MQTAQINARIGVDLKREGDATLARFGTSATEAIRALWGYLADSKQLPSFMKQDAVAAQTQDTTSTSSAPEQGAGLALRLAQTKGLSTAGIQELGYEELRDLAFEEMLEEGRFHA